MQYNQQSKHMLHDLDWAMFHGMSISLTTLPKLFLAAQYHEPSWISGRYIVATAIVYPSPAVTITSWGRPTDASYNAWK